MGILDLVFGNKKRSGKQQHHQQQRHHDSIQDKIIGNNTGVLESDARDRWSEEFEQLDGHLLVSGHIYMQDNIPP